jgi:3-oxoadipate enol-lactonase
VIAYDEPGYGDSPPPADASTRLGNLRSLLNRLEIERAVLVAHSGGANPALGMAIEDPERVAGLVLIAPGAHDYPWPLDDPYYTEFDRQSRLGNDGGLVQLGLRTWAAIDFGEPGASRRRRMESGVARVARSQFRRAVASWEKIATLGVDGPPVYDRLAKVKAPATVLVGDAEHPMVEQSTRDITERLKGAKLTVVPGADHLLPLRTPAAVAAAA